MTTTVKQSRGAKRWYNDGGLFLYHFIRSNYITALWNWFMGLAGKAAEPVLFASVLYSGYQLVPGVPLLSPGINALAFVTQQAALDVGGMGLIKLTKDEDPNKFKFARRTGLALISLMVVNMVVATAGRVFNIPAPEMQFVEGILLIVRSVMAVLFGHAIHTLKDDNVDSVDEDIESVVMVDLRESQEARIGDLEQQVADMKVQVFMQTSVNEEVQSEVQESVYDPVQREPSNLIDLSARICARESAFESEDDSEDRSESEPYTDKLSRVKRKSAQKVQSGSDVTRKVNSILKRSPKITASALAVKAGISESYASKLKALFNKEQTEGA